MSIKEKTRRQKQHTDRADKKYNRHHRDRSVTGVNEIARRHLPIGFDWQKGESVNERRQRRVVGIVPNLSRNIFAVFLKLADRAWPNKIGSPTLAAGNCAAHLRLIH